MAYSNPNYEDLCKCGHRYGVHSRGVKGPCLECDFPGPQEEIITPCLHFRSESQLEYKYPEKPTAEVVFECLRSIDP